MPVAFKSARAWALAVACPPVRLTTCHRLVHGPFALIDHCQCVQERDVMEDFDPDLDPVLLACIAINGPGFTPSSECRCCLGGVFYKARPRQRAPPLRDLSRSARGWSRERRCLKRRRLRAHEKWTWKTGAGRACASNEGEANLKRGGQGRLRSSNQHSPA